MAGVCAGAQSVLSARRKSSSGSATRTPSLGLAAGSQSIIADEATAKTAAVQDEVDWGTVSTNWEVDCFSRPVLRDGKKMWELLVTDENAVYRRVAQMKPTRVNSVVVQKLMTIFIEESKVKPQSIRFYRKVMKNMIFVALQNVQEKTPYLKTMKIVPSRNCHMLRQWLAWREREVYPKMDGFTKLPAKKGTAAISAGAQMSFEPIPQKLRFGRYVISAVPLETLAAVRPNAVPGKMARIPPGMAGNLMVYGIVIMSARAPVLSTLMRSEEICSVRLDLKTNELLLDIGLDKTYLIEKVPQEERDSALMFERNKRRCAGLHWIGVTEECYDLSKLRLPIAAENMSDPESEDTRMATTVTGLWTCLDYSSLDE